MAHSETKRNNIHILLIGNTEPVSITARVRALLKESISPHFTVYSYVDPYEAIDFLKKKSVDVILLYLGTVEKHNPEKFFQELQHIVLYTPVIVFTGEAEHDLTLLILRRGGADALIRESFIASPKNLKNTIEFTLAREKSLLSGSHPIIKDIEKRSAVKLKKARKESAVELQHAKEEGKAKLKKAQEDSAVELQHAKEEGEAKLKKAHEDSAVELQHAKEEGEAKLKTLGISKQAEIRRLEQIIFWLSGGYSFNSSECG